MIHRVQLVLLLLLAYFPLVKAADDFGWACPTDDTFDPACLQAATPPWPICLIGNHDAKYFVDKVVANSPKCCEGDWEEDCRCPFRRAQFFRDWCDKAAMCTTTTNEPSADDADESYQGFVKEQEDVLAAE